MTTLLRRKLALGAGLLCVAAPVLSSCGFDYATDRPNVIAEGGYQQSGTGMRVLAARIVAGDNNRGVFVATLALNPTADSGDASRTAAKLTGISAGEGSDSQVTASTFTPIPVTSTGAVNLADPSVGGIPVTGDFKAGSIIPIVMKFSDGESFTLQTPVVTQCHEYASVAPQAGPSQGKSASASSSAKSTAKARKSPSPEASGSAGASEAASPTTAPQSAATASPSAAGTATGSTDAFATDSASSSPSAAASAPYDCSFPSLPPIGE